MSLPLIPNLKVGENEMFETWQRRYGFGALTAFGFLFLRKDAKTTDFDLQLDSLLIVTRIFR